MWSASTTFSGARSSNPRLPDGTLDYENPDTMDLPLIKQCLHELSETGKTRLPIYDFTQEKRSDETEAVDLQGGVCIVEGIHALNPELTSLVPGEEVYRIYAGLREEYCIDGRRVINTQDIRLCRRTLRDAATRGRSPEKTLAMWDRVLDGETRYIKGFKTTADFLLDTSFTYELGLISNLLGVVRRQFTLEGHNAELWDETARRFEHVAPLSLDLLPPDSMLPGVLWRQGLTDPQDIGGKCAKICFQTCTKLSKNAGHALQLHRRRAIMGMTPQPVVRRRPGRVWRKREVSLWISISIRSRKWAWNTQKKARTPPKTWPRRARPRH